MIYEPDNIDIHTIISLLNVERYTNSGWNVTCDFDKLSIIHKHPQIIWFVHELIRALNVTKTVFLKNGKVVIVLNRIVYYM